MAITVKLQDATIALGGNFADALAYVKGWQGRKYDGATKTWTVPVTLKAFGNSFPYDVVSADQQFRNGEHVTRYGTRYSGAEWQMKREINSIQVPAEIMERCAAREQDAERAFVTTLRGFGWNDETIGKARAIYDRFAGDLDEAEQFGKIKFSSPERKAALIAAFETYYDALDTADDEARDYRDNEERRISGNYGY